MGAEVALIAGLIGTGISAWGSYQEGQDAKAASEYNASIKRQEASMIERSGALDAETQRTQVKQLVGSQKARYGASGIELGGSAIDVMFDTANSGERDAQIIEYNSKVRAAGKISEAAYDERLGDIYGRSSLFKAGTTLLTQGSQVGMDYYGGYKKPAQKQEGGY